jgi:hypothetical protein
MPSTLSRRRASSATPPDNIPNTRSAIADGVTASVHLSQPEDPWLLITLAKSGGGQVLEKDKDYELDLAPDQNGTIVVKVNGHPAPMSGPFETLTIAFSTKANATIKPSGVSSLGATFEVYSSIALAPFDQNGPQFVEISVLKTKIYHKANTVPIGATVQYCAPTAVCPVLRPAADNPETFGRARVTLVSDRLHQPKATLEVQGLQDLFGDPLKIQNDVTGRITKLEGQIGTKQLDDESLLPSRFLLSFGTASDSSTKLQSRLTDVSTQLLCMSTVLENGILTIASEWNSAPDWKKENAVIALPKLDSLGSTAMTEAAAQAGMTPILSAYELPPHVDADFAPRRTQIDPITVEEINYRVEHYSNTGWWIWGLVSVVVGCAILIVPNPGFGTLMDLILCLLWGLGIPTASANLQELTPSGVSGNIGIAFPKTGS